MVDVLIRGVSQEVLKIIKQRARKNRRSVQQELSLILSEATHIHAPDRQEIAERIRQHFLSNPHRHFSDSTDAIREDRNR